MPNVFEVLARNFNQTLHAVNFGRLPYDVDMPHVIMPIVQWCPELTRFTSFVSAEEIPNLYDLCARCTHLEELNVYGDT